MLGHIFHCVCQSVKALLATNIDPFRLFPTVYVQLIDIAADSQIAHFGERKPEIKGYSGECIVHIRVYHQQEMSDGCIYYSCSQNSTSITEMWSLMV